MTTLPPGWRLARFGVPALVLVFYATAALQFPYTPDGTYSAARETQMVLETGNTPAATTPGLPLILLAAAGRALELDPILVSKVFSLLSCSLALLLVYLLAVELSDDRIFALSAMLVVSGQAWLLQWAASGTGMGILVLFVTAALFFQQRNEYLVAVVCVAAAAMMTWHAAGLAVGIVLDAVMNARDRRRGIMVAFASVLVFLALVLPWILYASWRGLPVLTGSAQALPGPEGSGAALATFAGSGLLALGLLFREPGDAGGRHPALELAGPAWVVCWSLAAGLVWDRTLLFVALMVLTLLGFAGLARMLRRLSGDRPAYGPAILAAAALLFVTQAEYHTVTRPAMEDTVAANEELISVAYWIRSGVPQDATLAAERPGFLSYLLDREITAPADGEKPEFLVSTRDEIAGYALVYAPAEEVPVPEERTHFKIWRRQ